MSNALVFESSAVINSHWCLPDVGNILSGTSFPFNNFFLSNIFESQLRRAEAAITPVFLPSVVFSHNVQEEAHGK